MILNFKEDSASGGLEKMDSIKELAVALRELKMLLDNGILDEQEYNQNKFKLINSFLSPKGEILEDVDRISDDKDFLQDDYMHTIRY